ncbi:MAG: Crp/Fnr family transcriptional regulator [Clostridiaceae bacterium]
MNILDYEKLLRTLPLFNQLTEIELSWLLNDYYCKTKTYLKDNIIYFENEKCKTLDIILQGAITVQKIDENGNVVTIGSFNYPEIIGGNILFSENNIYPMTITSNTKTILFSIEKSMILNLCEKNKLFLLEFLKCISNKTIVLTNKISLFSKTTIRDKIIKFLTYEYLIQKSNEIKLNIHKKDIAERFAIERPSLSRELNKMRKEGIIEFDSKTIVIKDMNILKLKKGLLK